MRIRLAVYVLGFIGLVIACRQAVEDTRDQVLPGPLALVAAGLLTLVSLVLAGRAWTSLFDPTHDRRALAGSLYASQLTKYLPAGGFVQAAGQVGMSVTAGARFDQAASAIAIWAFTTVVAGCTMAAGLVFVDDLPWWARALSVVGLLTPVLLHRRVVAWALHTGHRIVKRVPEPDVLPTQRRLLISYAWSLGNMLALSTAYAVLLLSLDVDAGAGAVMSAFALSWVVGFLVFPIPAGIGVREAVLVAVIPGVPAAALLSTSLALRLLTIGCEVAATTGNRLLAQWERRHRPPSDVTDPAVAAASNGGGSAQAVVSEDTSAASESR